MMDLKIVRKPDPDFETEIGDGIEITVWGDFSAPDRSAGYHGDYEINKVAITTDLNGTDILSLLSDGQIETIRHEGWMKHMEENSYMKKYGEV